MLSFEKLVLVQCCEVYCCCTADRKLL